MPIGLIDTSWGGTIIETWTSHEALATMPSMQKRLKALEGQPATQEGRKKKYEADVEAWKVNIEKIDKGVSMARLYGQLPILMITHGRR